MRLRSNTLIALLALLMLLSGCRQADPGYQLIDNLEQLPEAVRFWASAYSHIFVGTSMHDAQHTYVLLSAGPVSDPELSVNILDIQAEAGVLYVDVDLAAEIHDEAQPGEQLSYPYALARLPQTDLPIKFRSTVDSELWIPQVIGAPAGWVPLAGPDGQSIYHEARLQIVLGSLPPQAGANHNDGPPWVIEGIARVFEATVEQDWLADGRSYGHSFTTAATGAPDWGYFRFELTERYSDTVTLRIYSTSAKDGSMQNLVTVNK